MNKDKQYIVSHAPFWHIGTSVAERNVHIILAAMIAVIAGIYHYGISAIAVVAISVSTAMLWEFLLNWLTKRPVSIGNGNAALMGLLFSMLIPATTPIWVVITGTFLVIVIGQQIFGGIGANPFNPVLIGIAIIRISWGDFFDFDEALLRYDLGFNMIYPLAALKSFGTGAIKSFSAFDLLMGRQIGGIGATFGIGLILGGIYLIVRGFIRWEISVSFLVGIFITAFIFNQINPTKYAEPLFHILTGYTLIGAFYLATEDSTSPVNFFPMLIYGMGCGIMTILIRNIGDYVDGVVFAILLMNLANPLIDKIRPKAMGKVM
ncbi:MAG: RnfABCDGE type electron transport complex subunit D [Desulfobacterales bacterium]|nr:RnfABCDGE type electron transport complex subunit D [Desulfobacterales bacterium]